MNKDNEYIPDRPTGEVVIDRWFTSDLWKEICRNADDGDEDSQELMEQVNMQLSSLIFHAANNSTVTRIEYELKYFIRLCDDFNIPNIS